MIEPCDPNTLLCDFALNLSSRRVQSSRRPQRVNGELKYSPTLGVEWQSVGFNDDPHIFNGSDAEKGIQSNRATSH